MSNFLWRGKNLILNLATYFNHTQSPTPLNIGEVGLYFFRRDMIIDLMLDGLILI